MPLFRFRLEAQDDSSHYRGGTISADNEATARDYLTNKEAAAVAYRLTTEELADAEAKEKDGLVDAGTRARLASHRQAKPYKLVSLKAVKS